MMHLMYHDIKEQISNIESDYDIHIEDFKKHVDLTSSLENAPIFTFDDGKKGCYEASKVLDKHNMKGIFFIITSLIDKNGYLSARQILDMCSRGHQIGSHSHTHPLFKWLDNDKVEHEIFRSKKILEGITGENINQFAFPGGKYRKVQISIVKNLGLDKIYDSFEKIPKHTTNAVIHRFHVRQSTSKYFDCIINKRRSYLAKRFIRSLLSEWSDIMRQLK